MSIEGKPVDGPISRYVNRRISMRITGFIVKHGIPLTPNMISWIAFLIALSSLPLYVMGYVVLAGVLAQFSSIIDGVDGELARVLKKASKKGGFLDTMLDRYADLAILAGVSIHVLTHQTVLPWAIVALLAISGDHLVSYIHTRAPHDFNIHPALVGPLDSIASRDVRIFVIFIGSIIGYLEYTLLFLAILTHLYVATKTWTILARVHE